MISEEWKATRFLSKIQNISVVKFLAHYKKSFFKCNFLLFWEQTLEVNRLVEILDFKNSVNVWIIFKPVNFGDND